MKSKSGLGRGLDSLIPKDLDTANLLNEGERIQSLLVTDVQPNSDQPRMYFDKQALEELAQSIEQYGIVQPLVVKPLEHNKYSIIAGERRWRAAQIVGLKKIPAIIRNAETLERLEIALVENVQRVDLSPLEQAVSIERLHQQFNFSYKDIAKRLGKAATTVNNIVRLLQLPEKARQALRDGKISEGHARAILALKGNPKAQAELLRQIVAKNWSVRQAEQFVVSHREGAKDRNAVSKRMAQTTPETEELSKRLKAPVTVRRTAKGGRLEIAFDSDDELTRIIRQIG